MANTRLPRIFRIVSVSLLTAGLFSCSSLIKGKVIEANTDVPETERADVTVPGYAGVPHPLGLQIGDVAGIFLAPDAPKREGSEMQTCDSDYLALEKKTKAKEELKQGLLELLRKEPIRYHWCFYSKILELESTLRKAQMLDERQKTVVDAYRFLGPLSRAFYREYKDSRYLRWAVSYYRRASELAFYRRVEASPGLTQELVGVGQDDPNRGLSEKSTSVLEKYGIVIPERLQPGQPANELKEGEVLPNDAYVDTGSNILGPLEAPVDASANLPVDRAPASAPPPATDTNTFPAQTPDSAQLPN